MSNASASNADAPRLIGPRLERLQHQRRVAQRDQAERERDRRANRILRRDADVEQDPQRILVALPRDVAETGGGAAQQILDSPDRCRRTSASFPDSRCATSSWCPSGRSPPRWPAAFPSAPTAATRPACRARSCRRSSRSPSPHRPAAALRAWRSATVAGSALRSCSRQSPRSRCCGRNRRRGRVADQHLGGHFGSLPIAASARTSAGRTNSPSSFSSAASSFGASAGSGFCSK